MFQMINFPHSRQEKEKFLLFAISLNCGLYFVSFGGKFASEIFC